MAKLIAVEGQRREGHVWSRHARSLWLELRPQQWVKNLLVLAPLLFSQNLFVPGAVLKSLLAFATFCLVSSSVYVFNDLQDREEDRSHPQKRLRPIASGELASGAALGIVIALLLLALTGGLAVGTTFTTIIGCYWIINLLYSARLKHLVILDVFAIASGFVLRVVGGGLAIQVEISHWLVLCTMLLSLFLGFSKRRHELIILGNGALNHRRVLGEYSPQFLDMMIGIVTACTVMSYALYTVSEETVHRFHTRALLMTLPFVLYGIFRYLYVVYHKNQGGDPTESLLSDWSMIINICLWAATAGIILYSN
jgi:4-hydroxybenzoate polyprenyltransferase